MRRSISKVAVPHYLSALLEEVEEKTGCPISLLEESAIGYDSETRFARPGQRLHEIAYSPVYRDFALHFLTSGALKIVRFWSLSPDEQYVPAAGRNRRLPGADHLELCQKLRDLSASETEDLSRFLYQGLGRQLTSMPGDIRVEREIAERFPEHRTAQEAYLRRQVQDLVLTLLPEMARFCPERLYAASTAMNSVLAETAAEIAGVPVPPAFQEHPHRALSERLQAWLKVVEEPGYPGDRMLTDAWSKELGFEDWYQWVRMDLAKPN